MLTTSFQHILRETKNKPDWAYDMTQTEDIKYNAIKSTTTINVFKRDLVQRAFFFLARNAEFLLT